MLSYTKTSKLHLLPGVVILLGILLASTLFSPLEHSFAARAATCTNVPSTFDATTATSAQLEQYGLPLRPDATKQPNAYKVWQTIVSKAKTRHCTTTTTTSGVSAAKAVKASTQSQASQTRPLAYSKSLGQGNDVITDNTASYDTDGYTSNVTEVVGTFVAPTAQDSNAGVVQTAISFGWGSGITLAMGLYSDQGDHHFWYEDSSDVPYGDTQQIRSGDSITVVISYDSSAKQVYGTITDTTSGAYFAPSQSLSAGPATNAAWLQQKHASDAILNFGFTDFSGVNMAHDNGDLLPLSWMNYHRVLMYNGNKELVDVSALNPGGASFRNNWSAAS